MGKAACLLMLCELLVAATTVTAQPARLRDAVEASVDNIVRVRTRWPGGPERVGFAYLVSVTPSQAVLVTAAHVVSATMGAQLKASDDVSLEFAGGKVLKADRIDIPDQFNDVAVLTARLASPVFMVPAVEGDHPDSGERAWLFGFDQKLAFVGSEGRTRTSRPDALTVIGLGQRDGSSGAPVFSIGGLVGLYHRANGTSEALVIPLATLKAMVAKAGRSWGLVGSQWVVPSVRLVISRLDRLEVKVEVRQFGGPAFSVPGAHEVPAGDYGLEYDMTAMTCVPQQWQVNRADPRQEVAVRCTPKPDGMWVGNDLLVSLKDIGTGDLEFLSTGSGPTRYLKGRLVQVATDPRAFQALLRDLQQNSISGRATLSVDMKILTLDVSGGSFRIQEPLTRHP